MKILQTKIYEIQHKRSKISEAIDRKGTVFGNGTTGRIADNLNDVIFLFKYPNHQNVDNLRSN